MDFPIYDGREVVGTLRVRREGLYAVFRAELPRREGLRRLWLCGRAESVCFGVLEPQGGLLRLEKKLSRAACASLPEPLLYAALQPSGAGPAALPAPKPSPESGERRVELFGRRFIVFRS